MIITVTPNPSVDRTVFLQHLTVGSVNRGQRSYSEPSGKGVNVALALHAHGIATRAIVTAGGPVGVQLRQMLDLAGLDTVVVPIDGDIRSNISLTQPDGTVTKVNETGPALSAYERDLLTTAVTAQLGGADWLVCAGSLPGDVPDGWYGELIDLAHARGVRVAVDTSGATLAESLSARPDLVKPNLQELRELSGAEPTTIGDVVEAAQAVRRRGAHAVLASLGGDGAVLVDVHGALVGTSPVSNVVSTVGAGDAMLAGYLSCTDGRQQALSAALRWGAAAVQHEGTLFSLKEFQTRVTISDRPDLTRPIQL